MHRVVAALCAVLVFACLWFRAPLWTHKVADMASLRTGDLVLFKFGSRDLSYKDVVTVLTHVGIVVRKDGVPHILEMHEAGDLRALGIDEGGVHLNPLADRVRTYEGVAFALRLRPHVAPDEAALHAAMPDLMRIPFYEEYHKHFTTYCVPRMLCRRCMKPAAPRPSMFCSEFVGRCLQVLGVLPPQNFGCTPPERFMHMTDVFEPPTLLK